MPSKTDAWLTSNFQLFQFKIGGTSRGLQWLTSFLLLAGKKLRILFRILVSLNPYMRGFMTDGMRRNSIEMKFIRL